MDQTNRAAKENMQESLRSSTWKRGAGEGTERADALLEDHLNTSDVSSTPVSRTRGVSQLAAGTPCTPQECTTMVNAVEQAMNACDVTAGTGQPGTQLAKWLTGAGVQLPTPMARDLKSLTEAAAENKRLKQQQEVVRQAELELAARETEEHAEQYALLEEENRSLAAHNARLQQQIAELTDKAAMALQRAEDARRLSGVYEEKQQASMKQLNDAEEQLSAVKALTPTNRAQQKEMHRRLLQAEQDVQTAAAAAQEATRKLQLVLDEKDKVQQELQDIKQQLEDLPVARQHADLYNKLAEAHRVMLEEKQQHQKLTGSLLEHAGRLSHKYYALSDDYGVLQKKYGHLLDANEQLATQLKEAHEALYELQVSVQATPPAKRREQQHLISRVSKAEQAVQTLVKDKQQLQERLLQAQAFIACLEQRSSRPVALQQQVVMPQNSGHDTPVIDGSHRAASLLSTPVFDVSNAAQVVKTTESETSLQDIKGPTATGAARVVLAQQTESFSGFITPVKGRSNPLFDLPETPGTILPAAAGQAGVAQLAAFPVEPVSPILAAAAEALSTASGAQQKQHIQLSAASQELQTVQHEQLGLRDQLNKARSELADIAGKLHASISGSTSSSRSGGHSTTCSTGAIKGQLPVAAVATRRTTAHSFAEVQQACAAAAGGFVNSVASRMSTLSDNSNVRSTNGSKQRRDTIPEEHQGQQRPATNPSVGRTAAASKLHDFAFPELGKHPPSPASATSSSANQRFCQQQPAGHGSSLVPTSKEQTPVVHSTADQHPLSTDKAVMVGSSQAAGSLSLDDLIKEAESVSLEYGMSPHQGAEFHDATASSAHRIVAEPQKEQVQPAQSSSADNQQSLSAAEAAARRVALALVEHGLTQDSACKGHTLAGRDAGAGLWEELCVTSASSASGPHLQQAWMHSCHTPGTFVDSAKTADAPVPYGVCQSQPATQVMQQQSLAELLATPGSASSAAGMPSKDAAVAAKQWLQQQVNPQPLASIQGHKADQQLPYQAADMNSAVRAAAGDGVHGTAAASTPAAQLLVTPSGMEGCASNILPSRCSAKVVEQNLQQSLVTPSYATPTAFANQRAAIAELFAHDDAAVDDASSDVKQNDSGSDIADKKPLQWQLASAYDSCVTPAVGTAAYVMPAAASLHGAGAAGVTAAKVAMASEEKLGATASTAAAAAAVAASETPDALRRAAVALLASVSPAGLLSSDIVAPAQLTPEWLRELKHRCQQGTLQVKELRQQYGLATPEAATSRAAEAQEAQQISPQLGVAEPAHARSLEKGTLQEQPVEGLPATDTAPRLADTGLDQNQQASTAYAAEVSLHVSKQDPERGNAEGSARRSSHSLRRRALAQATSAALMTPTDSAVPYIDQPLGLQPTAVGGQYDLERSDSAGSLAQYMQGDIKQRQPSDPKAVNVDAGRTLSGDASPCPVRPDCPTPGSAYSTSFTPGAQSPDLLLAGLNSSMMRARQLQEQLQRHLAKTMSLPANYQGKPEATATDKASTDTAVVTIAANNLEAPIISTQSASAAEVTPVSSARTGSRLCSAVQGSLLDVIPAASPITPGAALNASAESRLLSPSVQLDQVFDDAVSCQPDCVHSQQQQQQQQQPLPDLAGDTPQASTTCKQRPSPATAAALSSFPVSIAQASSFSPTSCSADTAATAACAGVEPSSPAEHQVLLECTRAVAPTTRGSLRAHELSSLAAGTIVMSAECYDQQTPSAATAAISVLQPGQHMPSTAATAAATSRDSHEAPASNPSLGSWVASQAVIGADADVTSAVCIIQPVLHVPAASQPCRTATAARRQSSCATKPAGHVHLGDSPTSSRLTVQSAAAPAVSQAASHKQGVSSEAFSAETPSSCCASHQAAGVSLGSSPRTDKTLQQLSAAKSTSTPSATASARVPVIGPIVASTREQFVSGVSGHPASTSQLTEQADHVKRCTEQSASVARSSTQAGSECTVTLQPHSSQADSSSSSGHQLTEGAADDLGTQSIAGRPASSNCTDFSSCRFATPALDSLNKDYSDSGQVYFTGLQHTSRSVSGRPTSAHKVEAVAFSGFATATQTAATPGLLKIASGAPSGAPAAGAAVGEGCPVAQNLLLQQLLASPSSTCASVAGSPACTAAAKCADAEAMQQAQQQVFSLNSSGSDTDAEVTGASGPDKARATDVPECSSAWSGHPVPDASPSRAVKGTNTYSRGSQTPQAAVESPAEGAADTEAEAVLPQQLSPTLSDLGFIDAPTSADFAAQQQHDSQEKVANKDSDLAGMTFQQRLELLCAEESSGRESSAASVAMAEESIGIDSQVVEEQQTPVLPAHVKSRATQTSPLQLDAAVQRSYARDAETQCTPAGRA